MGPWSYYSGCGNNFLIADDRSLQFDSVAVIPLCHDAAVDGLILLQPSEVADLRMCYYNRDGSLAAMCGNGVRCFVRFAADKGIWNQPQCRVEIAGRVLQTQIIGDQVAVAMGAVQELAWDLQLEERRWHYLDTGVPHLVTFVDNIETVDVQQLGPLMRSHERVMPAGANVNFVDPTTMRIRTYERGVEAETGACGTGTTAAAWCLHKQLGIASPIRLQVQSGDWLEVQLDPLTLMGPAVSVHTKAPVCQPIEKEPPRRARRAAHR